MQHEKRLRSGRSAQVRRFDLGHNKTLGPFREAHHVTGRVVALAESKARDLWDLPLDALQAIHPGITAEVYEVVTVEASVASRRSFGGTAPDQVRQQVAWWRARN